MMGTKFIKSLKLNYKSSLSSVLCNGSIFSPGPNSVFKVQCNIFWGFQSNQTILITDNNDLKHQDCYTGDRVIKHKILIQDMWWKITFRRSEDCALLSEFHNNSIPYLDNASM